MDNQRGDENKLIHYLLQEIQFLDVPQTAVEINNFIRTNMKLTKWS